MRICVVAEYYPDRHDPSHGIWAHRQALAATRAGAEVRSVVLHRPLPPLEVVRRPGRLRRWIGRERRQPRLTTIDGIQVRYMRFLAPPRPWSYRSWGAWAAPVAKRTLNALAAEWPLDLVHAHYALPAGRAVAGVAKARDLPLVISVHGGDLLDPALDSDVARRRVVSVLSAAAVIMCNSESTLERVAAAGVPRGRLRVVRPGASTPAETVEKRGRTTLVSSGYLVSRKRHEDVLRALALLGEQFPDLDYLVVGDGPERGRLEQLADELGVSSRVEFTGQLAPEAALSAVSSCHLMVLPSLDEAFGVVYGEAMAAGLPAIGCAGEGGPEEIAALGEGMVTVPRRDPESLAGTLAELLGDPARLAKLGDAARATATEHLSWERCGEETIRAYRDALGTRS